MKWSGTAALIKAHLSKNLDGEEKTREGKRNFSTENAKALKEKEDNQYDWHMFSTSRYVGTEFRDIDQDQFT